MYRLNEAWQLLFGENAEDDQRLIFCGEMDNRIVQLVNMLHDTVACYTISIITSGRVTLLYNGQQFDLEAGDLYLHTPEIPYEMVEATDNLHAYFFLVDLLLALSPDILRGVSNYIGMQLAEPRLALPPDAADRIATIMQMATQYYRSDKSFRDETLQSILRLLVLEVTSLEQSLVPMNRFSVRVEEIFIAFLRLVSQHYLAHRDLAFYADQLCISTSYLSRVVRQISGRTVEDYINYLLLINTAHLLQHTTLTVAQIADQLDFAETSSFVRFFQRMKGTSPTRYRESLKNAGGIAPTSVQLRPRRI